VKIGAIALYEGLADYDECTIVWSILLFTLWASADSMHDE
jgi:hypothetical protein